MVSQHPLADVLRGHLEVCHICHLQSRHQHTVAVHKLIEGATNWVASPTDPGRWDKTAQIKSLDNITLHITHPHPLTFSPSRFTHPQAPPHMLTHKHPLTRSPTSTPSHAHPPTSNPSHPHLMVSIMPEYRSCLVQSSRSNTSASLPSFGLMQRTKKGWHWLRVCMRASRERLN